MKKFLTLALSALLTMGLLTACGGKTTDKAVDLTAVRQPPPSRAWPTFTPASRRASRAWG